MNIEKGGQKAGATVKKGANRSSKKGRRGHEGIVRRSTKITATKMLPDSDMSPRTASTLSMAAIIEGPSFTVCIKLISDDLKIKLIFFFIISFASAVTKTASMELNYTTPLTN